MKLQPLKTGTSPAPIPKITRDLVESRIKSVEYFHIGLTITICYLRMVNGFPIQGEFAFADPRLFDGDQGKEMAYKNAFDKAWTLESYLLAERLSIAGATAV